MQFIVDPALVAGYLLASLRVAALVQASPMFPRSIPAVAKLGVILSFSMFFMEPAPDALSSVPALVGYALQNLALGAVLGFMTYIPFSVFSIAGGMVDVFSGLGVAAVLDPNQGISAAVFSRIFTLTALTMFFIIGGDKLVVHAISLSMEVLPLTGGLEPNVSLMPHMINSFRMLFIASIELVIAPVAALFLTEIVLALGSRFAPTANVFLLGLPLRLIIIMTVSGITLSMFPNATESMLREMREGVVAGLRGLGAA